MNLNTLWFLIISFVLAVYILLDGLDLGIGILSLFTPRDKHQYREQLIRIIGPHWDGNEVWLIVFGGMLFAVFPKVYAVLLSGLYLPFIFLLLVFMVRGISIPLRNRYQTIRWLTFWDLCFGISSFIIAFILGDVAANLIQGIPFSEKGVMTFNLPRLASPFCLWIGAFSVALLSMHGAIYASQEISDNLKSFCRKAGLVSWLLLLVLAIPVEIFVLINAPSNIFKDHFILFSLLMLVLLGSVVYVPLGLKSGRFGKTLIASILVTGCFLALFYVYSFPNLLRNAEPEQSLTIYNTAASRQTMMTALVLTIIAMPIVIAYSIYVHRILRRAEAGYA